MTTQPPGLNGGWGGGGGGGGGTVSQIITLDNVVQIWGAVGVCHC